MNDYLERKSKEAVVAECKELFRSFPGTDETLKTSVRVTGLRDYF